MTDDDPLSAFRLADSFLPIGSYAVSYGLEQFVQSGRVETPAELESLLETYLCQLLGRADLVALRAAHGAAARGEPADACAVDRRLSAVTMNAEFRVSARSEGQRLLTLHRDLDMDEQLAAYAERVDGGVAPGNYPVVLGVVTALEAVDERDACLLCCHAFVTGLLGAAQRLMSLGHTDAQRVLRQLQPSMRAAVDASDRRDPEDMAPFAPVVDIVSMEHERADRRLFVS